MSTQTITLALDNDMVNRIRRILVLLPASDSDAEDVVTLSDYLLYLLEKDLEFNEAEMVVNIQTGELKFYNEVWEEAWMANLTEQVDEESILAHGGRIVRSIRHAGWRELADVPAGK
jgi:hypothetical protein